MNGCGGWRLVLAPPSVRGARIYDEWLQMKITGEYICTIAAAAVRCKQ